MALQPANFSSGNVADGIMSSFFGQTWANMFQTGPTSTIASLLIDIFTIYNGAVVIATALVVGYTLWSSTVQTAHEGQTAGKRYSSLWMPLRMVVGGALTAPIFGLSLVQILVLAVAGLGFQTADEVANKVAVYVNSGAPLTTFPAFYSAKKDKALMAILQMETCRAYLEKEAPLIPVNVAPAWDSNQVSYGKEPLLGFKDDSCGTLKVNSEFYQTIAYAIDDIAATVRPAAAQIVEGKTPDAIYISTARNRLDSMDNDLLSAAKTAIDAESQKAVQIATADINTRGWIGLGSWYYTLARQTASFNEKINYDFDVSLPEMSKSDSQLGGQNESMLRAIKYAQGAGISISSQPDDTYMQAITEKVFEVLKGDGDPYLKMINLGHFCTQAAAVLSGANLAAKAVSFLGGGGLISKVASQVLDSGLAGSAVIFMLLAVGIVAGWGLPFVPLAVWTFGVCSVFIGVIQSFLAAPIWAAAHCLPDGDGLTGNHSRQGYLLLINLALRPVLITIGFVFSYFLLWGVCWLFLDGLQRWVVSGAQNTPGLDVLNFFLGLAVALFLAAITVLFIAFRCFGFIFDAADKVLSWIGGAEQFGGEDRGGAGRVIGGIVALPRMGAGAVRSVTKTAQAARTATTM